jgi:excisionase family DNA binding protein
MTAATLPHILTPQEVAAWLGTTTRAVVKMAGAGDVPHVRLPGGDIVFVAHDLAAWIESRRRPAADAREGVAHAG